MISATYDPDTHSYVISGLNTTERVYASSPEALELVRALFSAGLEFDMPDQRTFDTGRMSAMEDHLKDMRRIVFEGMADEKG